jgi:hypothetical protein
MVKVVRKHFQRSSKVIVAYVARKVTASDCWENPNNKGMKPVFNNKPTSPKNTNINREKLKCSYCGKGNHTVERYFKRIKSESPEIAEVALVTICEDEWYGNDYDSTEYCSLSYKQHITMEQNKMEADPSMWSMDSGSTSQLRFSKTDMTNMVKWKAPITLGNRQHIFSALKGTFKGQVFSETVILCVTMDDVLYIPDLMLNLFSLTKTLQKTKIGFATD